MVFYFTSNISGTPYTIYMGLDKHENEDLIKYGWPEDVWFHVDKLSSAHVYLRLKPSEDLDSVPYEVIQDCAQLVKANSIQGNKLNNIQMVYTFWSNLKKTGDMAVGQVGFHNSKEVRLIKVEKRINDVVNRLNKTKVENFPDLREAKEDRDRQERNEAKKIMKEQQEKEKQEILKMKQEKALRSYDSLFDDVEMKTNANNDDDSDDFM
ncbi:coiled-coil domain-containing protein 25-like [Styela clava]